MAASKGSKKGMKKPQKSDDKKKPRRHRRKESYSIYVYKVLKQVHPDTGISSKAIWALWIPSSTTFSSESLEKLRVFLITTSDPQSRVGRFKLPFVCSCLASLPSTPYPKELKLSPSTPAPSKDCHRTFTKRLFSEPPIVCAIELIWRYEALPAQPRVNC